MDKRKTRPRNPLARTDPRVVHAICEQAAAERLDCSATVGNRFRRRTQNRLDAAHGAGVMTLPDPDVFRRMVNLLVNQPPNTPACQRIHAVAQPDRTFGTVQRPGPVRS